MNATWMGVFTYGTNRRALIVRFRQASIEDIDYHLKNLYAEQAEEGYALESFELKGDDDDYLTEDWL